MKLLVPTLAALGIAAAVAAALVLAGDGTEKRPRAVAAPSAAVAPGPRAPALAGRDVLSGEEVGLADFAGRPVLLHVWSSWCRPCTAMAPTIARVAKAHAEVAVLGVDLQDEPEDAKRFSISAGWRHPSISDPSGELTARLDVANLPATIVLDRRHRIVARLSGAAPLDALENALARARRSS